MGKKDKMFRLIANWLLIIGGINWGTIVLGFNIVDYVTSLFGSYVGIASKIVYLSVGVSGVYSGIMMFKKK